MESFVSFGSDARVVATIGVDLGVVLRRCRVIAWPMPREAGVTRIQAMFEALMHTRVSLETSLASRLVEL